MKPSCADAIRNGQHVSWAGPRHTILLFKRRDQQHAARRASEAELAMRSSPSDMCQTAINRDDAERLQTLLSRLRVCDVIM